MGGGKDPGRCIRQATSSAAVREERSLGAAGAESNGGESVDGEAANPDKRSDRSWRWL
jgi:hypothetical protein